MSSSNVLSRRRIGLGGTWMRAPSSPCRSSRVNSPAPPPPDGWRLSIDFRPTAAAALNSLGRPNPHPAGFKGLLGADSFSDSVSEGTLPGPPSKSKKPESDLNIAGTCALHALACGGVWRRSGLTTFIAREGGEEKWADMTAVARTVIAPIALLPRALPNPNHRVGV
jgi:hypothetical protein